MAAALQNGTSQGTDKSKEQGSRVGTSNHKDAPKDMLYYAQKLSGAQGSGAHEEMEDDSDLVQGLRLDSGAEADLACPPDDTQY